MLYGLNTRTLFWTHLYDCIYIIMLFTCHFSCIRVSTIGHLFGPSCMMADMQLWCLLAISHALGIKHSDTYSDPIERWQIGNYCVY